MHTHTGAVFFLVFSKLGSPLFQSFFFEDLPVPRYISYLEWSSGVKLSEINEMVRGCKHQGPLERLTLAFSINKH